MKCPVCDEYMTFMFKKPSKLEDGSGQFKCPDCNYVIDVEHKEVGS